jgi:phenylpropionate dioxygenase-like ring-hydroxylating dioxygenase large terminal subunit
MTEQDKYDLHWYVIGEPEDFPVDRPKKAMVWGNNYVVWRTSNGSFVGLMDACPHKGASLSGGNIVNNNIMCPYHGYEFNSSGCLDKVPGLCFRPDSHYDVEKFDVTEKDGWVYLNTYNYKVARKLHANSTEIPCKFEENIFQEEDIRNGSRVVRLNMGFKCFSRILSENSLDVMHIAFVHTFGNAKNPSPTSEDPPKQMGKYHYKTSYAYQSGERSMARRMFGVRGLRIENEFVLPHTTVARVFFGGFVSTVVTFALPVNENESKLFVKTYRNFWENTMGDIVSRNMMYNTMLQDRDIVENIDTRFQEGNYNMKFDKLQNTYKTLYRRLIERW